MPDISYGDFRNALSLLRGLSKADIERAGVRLSSWEWETYERDRPLFFLSIGESRAEPIWRAMQARRAAEQRERVPA